MHYGNELSCTHECFESFPSLELGDLCSDTKPTVVNRECKDPVGKEKCGMPEYKNTPYNNYMSYANDSCTNHFTPQQVARMHCYIDLDYQSWQTNAKPSFVPLPPRIIEANKDKITLSWLPPLGPGGSVCYTLKFSMSPMPKNLRSTTCTIDVIGSTTGNKPLVNQNVYSPLPFEISTTFRIPPPPPPPPPRSRF